MKEFLKDTGITTDATEYNLQIMGISTHHCPNTRWLNIYVVAIIKTC